MQENRQIFPLFKRLQDVNKGILEQHAERFRKNIINRLIRDACEQDLCIR